MENISRTAFKAALGDCRLTGGSETLHGLNLQFTTPARTIMECFIPDMYDLHDFISIMDSERVARYTRSVTDYKTGIQYRVVD